MKKLPASSPPRRSAALLIALATQVCGVATLQPPVLSDDFSTYNASLWEYADHSLGTTDGCKVFYLKNHSTPNATLSLGEGRGLRMLMSAKPCSSGGACHGAEMAADHAGSILPALYGQYELRMRAPYQLGSSPPTCNSGIYAYFTAGFAKKGGRWNEINFGFHPDRDQGGTVVSCEHHGDGGGYHEHNASLGFDYRASFNTFIIRLSPGQVTWMVQHGGPTSQAKVLYTANATLTSPMTTRLILRTNFRHGDPGVMSDTVFEISQFRFTPAPSSAAGTPA